VVFATDGDVSDALGRSLTSLEANVVDNLIDEATDLVVGYGISLDISPVPGAIKRVVATMVAAVFSKPSINVADYDASGYSTAREAAGVHVGMESATTSGPWLTNALKERLKPYRISMRSVNAISEYGS